ncbi:UNVERIFIED_CONTAM: hypothetical protein FKN15_072541 [Acipenser sinensis]
MAKTPSSSQPSVPVFTPPGFRGDRRGAARFITGDHTLEISREWGIVSWISAKALEEASVQSKFTALAEIYFVIAIELPGLSSQR